MYVLPNDLTKDLRKLENFKKISAQPDTQKPNFDKFW